ncbi:MAG: thiol reductant ABC exporter subunit CydD [Chloroflexota bacterium]
MNLDRRLLALTWAVRLHLVATVALGLLAGLLTVGQAFLLTQVVAQVFLGERDLAGVQGPLLALLLVVVLRAASVWGRDVAAALGAVRIKAALRERFFSRLVDLGPAYTRGERTGELSNTALEGIEALDAYFAQYLPSLALAALIPLTVLVFIFPLDLLTGVVFLVTAPLIPLFMVLIGEAADHLTKQQWQSLSRLSAHFLDVLQGLTTLKVFGRGKSEIEVVARVSGRFGDATMKVLRVAFLSALVLEMLATISTAIVAVEVGLRLLYGGLTFEQAFLVLVLAPEFYLPLRTLGASFHAGITALPAAERIFAVVDASSLPLPVGEREEPNPLAPFPRSPYGLSGPWPAGEGGTPNLAHSLVEPDSPFPCREGGRGVRSAPIFPLAFHDISFTYPGEHRAAVRGVSFTVERGQRVALVGPSGAGKSTLANLLLCFLAPDEGEITVGGTSLRGLPRNWWRAQVAWVPQSPYLFNATVAENIRLARPTASMEEVARAASLAYADAFIAALPRGYDTPLGERGARLSGGQAQRLALARAFLKGAPLLVLDEPSANLDPEHEALLQASLATLLRERAALVIAHRLATVSQADQILVLADGQIVERGTHAELLATDGLYWQMVAAYQGGEA